MNLSDVLSIISSVNGAFVTRYANNGRLLAIDAPETQIEHVSCRVALDDMNSIILSFCVANGWVNPGYKCFGDTIVDTFGAYVVMIDHICSSDLEKIEPDKVLNVINTIKTHWQENKDKTFSKKSLLKSLFDDGLIDNAIANRKDKDTPEEEIRNILNSDLLGLNEN